MGDPIPKDGWPASEVYCAWVVRQCCLSCGASGPSDPHHEPPRRRNLLGDFGMVPLCRRCHTRAAGIPVVVDGVRYEPLDPIRLELFAAVVFREFILTASPEKVKTVLRDVARWQASRVFVVPA